MSAAAGEREGMETERLHGQRWQHADNAPLDPSLDMFIILIYDAGRQDLTSAAGLRATRARGEEGGEFTSKRLSRDGQ